MSDLDAKVQCLIGAFPHDKSVIIEVLKKNNYSLDAAAIELSEIPLPKQQPIPQPIPQYHQPPFIYHQPQLPPRVIPGQPQPQPQPIPQPPKVKINLDDQDVLYSEITKALGNTGLTESIISDVHSQNGKNFDNTVRAIKTMVYSPTEEHKRMEELQMKYEQENLLKEQMLSMAKAEEEKKAQEYLKRQQELQKRKEMEAIAMEKSRREKELMEQQQKKEMEMVAMEKARREKEQMEKKQQQQKEMEKVAMEKARKEKEQMEKRQSEEYEKLKLEKANLLAEERKERERLIKISEQKAQSLLLEIERQKQLIQQQESQKTIELKKQSEEQQQILEQLIIEQEKLRKLKDEEANRATELEEQKKKTEDLLKQTEHDAIIKELAHNNLIELQKKEITSCQQQIDVLKQKEYQSLQENLNISKKSQIEIEQLRQLLFEVEQKNKQDALRLENEEILRKQIQDLEDQKEFQRTQILELESIKKKKIQELEEELYSKQNELVQTKKANFISLAVELDIVQKEQINVEYHLESKYDQGANYWIGIYPTHQPKHERYHAYQKIQSASGNLQFPQMIPGHYEARLFRDKYTLLQTSSSVMIGPSVQLSVHVIGDKIDVTFKVQGATDQYQYNRDWLGIYPQGARNKKYVESIYANNNGSVTFNSPRVAGLYEIRYFTYPTKYNEQVKSSFELIDNDSVVISTPIAQPDESFKVEYTINTYQPSTSDWIGIFSVTEENNRNYIVSKYTNGTGHGQLEFNAPKPGSYEVRLFSASKGKYIAHKVSDVLIVTSGNN